MQLEVICGPMFSGKTEELIRRITRARYANQTVLSCKPTVDVRSGTEKILAHSGASEPCYSIQGLEQLQSLFNKARPQMVALEEVQFLQHSEYTKLLQWLFGQETKVVVAGLDMDFRGLPFENTAYSLSIAPKVDKLSAVCVVCGQDGTMTFKKSGGQDRVEIGDQDLYEARCYQCWLDGQHPTMHGSK